MKKLRGFKLVVLGCVCYLPNFIGPLVMENVPEWLFPVCATLFGICAVVGLLQIFFTKDPKIDEELEKDMKDRRGSNGKKGLLRF